mgnify:CR=1 FL=1
MPYKNDIYLKARRAVSLTFLVAEVLVFIFTLAVCFPMFIKKVSSVERGFVKSLIYTTVPFGLSIFFGSVYFYINSIILSYMKGDIELGVYSAAYNLALALLFIPAMYTSAIFPLMSRYYKESGDKLRYIYRKSFKYLYIAGLALSIFTFFRSESLISVFYGSGYSGAATALKIISFFIFIKFINFLIGNLLAAADRQNSRMAIQGLTAAFNVILSILLIPFLGLIGAAISTLVTEVLLFIVYFGEATKAVGRIALLPLLIRPGLAGLAMAIFLNYFDSNIVIEGLAAMLVYGIALIILRAFSSQDKELFIKVIRNG